MDSIVRTPNRADACTSIRFISGCEAIQAGRGLVVQAHLIWDWNGTLMDDSGLVLAATNEAFTRLHFPDFAHDSPAEIAPGVLPLTPARYQELFDRPLRKFFYAVTRRNITESEFHRWTALYLDAYQRMSPNARLNTEARAALQEWHKTGGSQSVLSLHEHDKLIQQVERSALTQYFVRIDGRSGAHGNHDDSKRRPLQRHLKFLVECGLPQISAAIADRKVIMIGDTSDDISAAHAAGVTCILYNKSPQIPGRPQTTGVPTAATLRRAVELAKVLVQ
ncbi:HAD hydrolase-like protein [Nocardia sp. NPDC004568]|uniref:HAD family hydrolase n=1 Tax=Nocardia sp. NPDC004568 TaxID=3154551 RepID=UPI0033A322F4